LKAFQIIFSNLAAVPIATAMMTPIPLMMALIGIKIRDCYKTKYNLANDAPGGDQVEASRQGLVI
jgi:hypothetical protein